MTIKNRLANHFVMRLFITTKSGLHLIVDATHYEVSDNLILRVSDGERLILIGAIETMRIEYFA